MEVSFKQTKLEPKRQSPVESKSPNHYYRDLIPQYTSGFIMVVNASRNVITHSYAQVLDSRQTRPYFQGALISAENWVAAPDYQKTYRPSYN